MLKFNKAKLFVVFLIFIISCKEEKIKKSIIHNNFIISDGTSINEYATVLFKELHNEDGYILVQKNKSDYAIDSFRIIKFNKKLDILWIKKLELNNISDKIILNKCLLLSTDDIIIAGTLLPNYTGNDYNSSFISKIDKYGSVEYTKIFKGTTDNFQLSDIFIEYPNIYCVSLIGVASYVLTKVSMIDNSVVSKKITSPYPYNFKGIIVSIENNNIVVAGNNNKLFIHHFNDNLSYLYGSEFNMSLYDNNFRLKNIFKSSAGYIIHATGMSDDRLSVIHLNDSFQVTSVVETNLEGLEQIEHVNNEFHISQKLVKATVYYVLDDNLRVGSFSRVLSSVNPFGWSSRFIEHRSENKIEFLIDNVGPEGGSGFQFLITNLKGMPCFNYEGTASITQDVVSFLKIGDINIIPYADYTCNVLNYNLIVSNISIPKYRIIEVCSK
jgi:hypothetical protein